MLRYEDLPKNMQNSIVKNYYDILNKKKVSLFIKAIMDRIIALIMLIILLPVFVILAIIIKIDSKGPVFYKQTRVTRYGKKFKIFKFRTMVINADKIGTLVTVGQDKRITRVGRIIRKIRLDELPQLINILLGDMSFVGTRPEVEKYVNEYTEDMKATLLMKAGVTSNASINYKDEDEIIEKLSKEGRSVDDIYIEVVLPEKMKYNLEYIKKFSVIEDIKACINTVIGVLK